MKSSSWRQGPRTEIRRGADIRGTYLGAGVRLASAGLALAGVFSCLSPFTVTAGESDVVAVYASISPDYHRVKTSSGAFEKETYAFGQGEFSSNSTVDPTIDHLSFLDVARRIAPALASKNYVPCDPKFPRDTKLLIMVYWGRTVGTDATSHGGAYDLAHGLTAPPLPPPSPAPDGNYANGMTSDPTMSGRKQELESRAAIQQANDSNLQQSLMLTGLANAQRERQDVANATVLGYLPELKRVLEVQGTPRAPAQQDVVDDVEEARYYVVLLAYDCQQLLQHKQRRLLWEARYSIPARRSAFDEALARMSQEASKYFGQESHGLIRQTMPSTNVIIGPLRVVAGHEKPEK